MYDKIHYKLKKKEKEKKKWSAFTNRNYDAICVTLRLSLKWGLKTMSEAVTLAIKYDFYLSVIKSIGSYGGPE